MLFFADSGEGVGAQAMLMGSAATVIVLTLAAINASTTPIAPAWARSSRSRCSGRCGSSTPSASIVKDSDPVPCDARGARIS